MRSDEAAGRDVCLGQQLASRAIVMQQNTQRPVQFEITVQTRESVEAWIMKAGLAAPDFLFPSRLHKAPHFSTSQYSRLVHWRVASIGLDDSAYGTYAMRRTKASLIYRRTKTFALCNCSLATPSLRAPYNILASKSTTRLKWRSRPTQRTYCTNGRRLPVRRRPRSMRYVRVVASRWNGVILDLFAHSTDDEPYPSWIGISGARVLFKADGITAKVLAGVRTLFRWVAGLVATDRIAIPDTKQCTEKKRNDEGDKRTPG
jgi:hypothetical protein